VRRALVLIRARARVVAAWLRLRHAVMAAHGARTTLTCSEWIGADASVLCDDHSAYVGRIAGLREAEEAARVARRKLRLIRGKS
jgi:hypothetical protein